MRDAKAAGPVGALLGWIGWSSLLAGTFLAFTLMAVVGIWQIVTRRASRQARFAFGPYLYGSTLVVVLVLGGR